MKEYDGIVIGSGQGGNPLAHKLADRGWTVALVEREHLGGTCVNYGCTPTKTMIASARAAHDARRAASLGVYTGRIDVRLSEVVARKRRMVEQWRSGQEKQAADRETLTVVRAHARFVEPHVVEAGDETLRGEHVFIDTGCRTRIPEIDGLEDVEFLTNRTIMEVEDLPEHLVVVGGGYVSLEFAQMFRRFGSKVTVLQRAGQLAPREDPEIAAALQEVLEGEGVTVHTDAGVRSVSERGTSVDVLVDGLRIPSASHVLLAVGRIPNTDDLELDAAGVETDDRGYIVVDEHRRTTADRVWAMGDVTGGPAFTHISYDDHLVVYDDLFGNGGRTASHRIVPYALFTDPELGRVGMTEREASRAGYSLKIGSVPMERVARARESGRTEGLMKIVIDASTDLILGAAILGAHGGETIQVLTTAMMADLPWTRLRHAVFIHPTLVEGLFGLMESVENV